ncbi:hypothetical protein EV401DRAFT_2070136 [Pisolithus croceorrhizus]|nr:hypothetical protein EV401DRAFT_2070136 [Pisolithus croceorrhizus]
MSSSSNTTLRRPSEAHRGQNGFSESFEPADKDHPGDITLRNVRYAQWMLKHKGVPLPRWACFRTSLSLSFSTLNPSPSLRGILRQQQRKTAGARSSNSNASTHGILESLCAFQASELRQKMLDHRRCIDDSAYMDIDESYSDQVEFREALRSIEEYRDITERDVQLRMARFLVADGTEQERMMDKFGWAYRRVDPLRAAYKSNAEFRTEIQDTLKDIQASDPRKRVVIKHPIFDQALPYATFSPLS